MRRFAGRRIIYVLRLPHPGAATMIENTKLTALVASRICHDMVEPMSAIIQGLEMIKDGDGKPDPGCAVAAGQRRRQGVGEA